MEGYQLTTPQLAALFVLIAWDVTWKGLALWRAAKNNHQTWFIFLLIINSIGILPILYIVLNKGSNKKS